MPSRGKRWRHIIVNTKNTWLHGEDRGFRHRHHDIHSSGDYRHLPPPGEHAGLYRYMKSRAGPEVHIPVRCRATIGRAIVTYLCSEGHAVLAISVGRVHTHYLVELPDRVRDIKDIRGETKRISSRSVKKDLPGEVWAAGGTYKPVDDRTHLRNAYRYILYEQGPDDWTWSYKDPDLSGMTTKVRLQKRRAALRSARVVADEAPTSQQVPARGAGPRAAPSHRA